MLLPLLAAAAPTPVCSAPPPTACREVAKIGVLLALLPPTSTHPLPAHPEKSIPRLPTPSHPATLPSSLRIPHSSPASSLSCEGGYKLFTVGVANLIPDLVKEVELTPNQRVVSTHNLVGEAIEKVQRENMKADRLRDDNGQFGILEDTNPILISIQRLLVVKHRRKSPQQPKAATIAGLQSFIQRLKK
ncbi:hypothetical protein JCM10295v2_004399 [Rhodotorula toruloides]